MGNKCKHCLTMNGNNKYVCDKLQNLGGGCGKCKGIIYETEKQFMIDHYAMRLNQLKQEKQNIEDLIKTIENLTEEVRSARSVVP